jgi:predicted phage terminase large subunit-like protein
MNQTRATLDELFELLRVDYSKKKENKMSLEDKFILITHINTLVNNYINEEKAECCRLIIKNFIPFLETTLVEHYEPETLLKVYEIYKGAFALAGQMSLEHFILYYEWEWNQNDKLYENRQEVLKPFVFYLNKSAFDPNLKMIIASYMPSSGKSRVMSYYEAWRLGIDPTGAILRISYDDSLVKGFSRSVIDIIKSEPFGEIFPELNYNKNKRLFLKETDEEWKLNKARLNYSYIAKTRGGGITGARASLSIDIDDIIKDEVEAKQPDIHTQFWTKWLSVIKNRKSGKNVKYIIVGTKWSPDDFLCKLGDNERKRKDFINDPLFKFVEKSVDGSVVIISIPALDPDTEKSTCEHIATTEELLELRDDIDPYFWQCVYQQDPIPPEGLDFAKENLTYYDRLPLDKEGKSNLSGECLSVLDPARKGKNYVSMPIFKQNLETGKFYMVDVLYRKKSMQELYDIIVSKLIEHEVTSYTIENNTDTSLKHLIEKMLHEQGYYNCVIDERFENTNKEQRIKQYAGDIKNHIVYKDKSLYSSSSDYGVFMQQLNSYSFDAGNKFDDAPDSIALFAYKHLSGKRRKGTLGFPKKILDL